jgi:hypothetical protein
MKVASSAGQVEPRSTDILLGRGNGVSIWKGNINFRHIVWKYRDEYRQAVRYQKGKIAEKVFEHISTLSPPGRFLEMIEDDQFYIVDRERAIEKICQALREKKNILAPNTTLGSAPSNSTNSKMGRYKTKQMIVIAPTPASISSVENAQTSNLQAQTFASTISSSRSNVVTPDHVPSPSCTASETREKIIKRTLFSCAPSPVKPKKHTISRPLKKAKVETTADLYPRNNCTRLKQMPYQGDATSPATALYPSVSLSTEADQSICELERIDDTTARLVSFFPSENLYELSDNHNAMGNGNGVIASIGSSWTHQRDNQLQHSHTERSSVERSYMKHQPNALEALFDYEDSIDMHLEGISLLSATGIEHGAQYIKSSIEILDDAFALIRNVTGAPTLHVPTTTTRAGIATIDANATSLEAAEHSELWSSTLSLGDCADSGFFNDTCMTYFTGVNEDIDNINPDGHDFNLSGDSLTTISNHFDPPMNYIQSGTHGSNF